MILKWRPHCNIDCPKKKQRVYVNNTIHSSKTNHRGKKKQTKVHVVSCSCLHGSHHSNRNHVAPPSAASFGVAPPQQLLRRGGSDELLCVATDGEVLPRGLVEARGVRDLQGGQPHELGPRGVHLAHDVWAGLLRRGDDAHGSGPLRSGPLRNHLQAQPTPVRLHDRCWHPHQQDGPCPSQVSFLLLSILPLHFPYFIQVFTIS